MNFFVVSAGKPGSDYIEENFSDILNSQEFALHKETRQKGTFYSIQEGDVLILKYQKNFVAFGIVIRHYENIEKDFSLRVQVEQWILHNAEEPGKGISRHGIQKATIGGGRYGTVKTVRPNFGLDKIRKINDAHPSYDKIEKEYSLSSSTILNQGEHSRLHEELFNYLLDKSEADSEFTFVIRDSNNAGTLEKGLWFYGKETVALSFWTGMDYIAEIPAISFLINPNQHCKLIIQTDVFEDLQEILKEEDISIFYLTNLKEKDTIFYIDYNSFQLTDYINCLDEFFKKDYKSINRILDNYGKTPNLNFEQNNFSFDSLIQKFPIEEFNLRLNNVFRYRQREMPELTLYSLEDEKKADSINWITIENYGLIHNQTLEIGNSSWVFITGENGSGKTMLLKAIGSALGNRTIPRNELKNSNYKVNAELIADNRKIPFNRLQNYNVRSKRAIVPRGLAMYGPYRLQQTSGLVNDETFRKYLSKLGSFNSMFGEGAKLLSFDKQFELWQNSSERNNSMIESRLKRIIALLPKIIPDLRLVKYKRKSKNKYEFNYLIRTSGSDELSSLKWDELSSGNRNILNLVSDIIIRLFHQQSKIIDPSELRGIVLIDEIDLHLHPKAQKDLVITLSETFPLIQFIVTTHSPITLLGAPKDSAIFVVKRDWEKGVYTERLKKLENELQYLTPNTLLTSKIFDMDFLLDKKRDEILQVYTEDNYEDVRRNKTVEKNLRTLEKDALPKDLFK